MENPKTDKRRPAITFSLWQRLRFLGAYLGMTSSMVHGLLSGIFRGKSGATTYGRHMMMATVRALTDNFDELQLQHNAPKYDQVYTEFCNKHALTPDFVTQNGETIGFWLGPRSAKHVVMHFHGGAFVMDITGQHLRFWRKIQQELASSNIEISIFFSIYTLVPHKSYPTQFIEAVEGLNYLVEVEGCKPKDITLSGDSAGANLCTAIISHLSHPSSKAPRVAIDVKIGGLIQISPWMSFDTSWPSMKNNVSRDIDSTDRLQDWARLYLNGRASDNYSEPVLAPSEWWRDAPVERTLVVVGEDEMFMDGAKAWTDTFRDAGNDTEWKVAKGEFHIEPFIGPAFGDEKETGAERDIKLWLRERFG